MVKCVCCSAGGIVEQSDDLWVEAICQSCCPLSKCEETVLWLRAVIDDVGYADGPHGQSVSQIRLESL